MNIFLKKKRNLRINFNFLIPTLKIKLKILKSSCLHMMCGFRKINKRTFSLSNQNAFVWHQLDEYQWASLLIFCLARICVKFC